MRSVGVAVAPVLSVLAFQASAAFLVTWQGGCDSAPESWTRPASVQASPMTTVG
jgi:hypothetical protein